MKTRYILMAPAAVAVAAAGLAVAPTGCQELDRARSTAATGAAYSVTAECAVSLDQRRANVEAINRTLAERGRPERVIPLDCNGDEKPDF